MKQQVLGLTASGGKPDEQTHAQPPFTLIKGYLNSEQQAALVHEAHAYPFTRPILHIFGKSHPIPRTQVWFGDIGCDYRYSGLLVIALPWPQYAQKLRLKLQREVNLHANGVLVNHYADGTESMGWHTDDEAEIVDGSDIASISIGASRDFVLRHKVTHQKVNLILDSGDLLLMHWPMQRLWQHSLPKRLAVHEPRINYTFRRLSPHFHST